MIVDKSNLPPFTRRGKADEPKPFEPTDTVFKFKNCPDCDGRGWFLINPFATGGRDGSGGLGNKTQCLTCADAYAFFNAHGCLPPELESEAAK